MSEQAQKAVQYQIKCPNHPKYDKKFTNKVFADQELGRHKTEAMPKGMEAELVEVE